MRNTRILIGTWILSAAFATSAAGTKQFLPSDFNSSFTQIRTLPGFTTPLVSYGNVRIDSARGFHWEITSPYHYEFEMQGEKAQEQLPDGTIRQLNPEQTPWLAAVEHIFVSALADDHSDLQRYFKVDIQQLPKGQRILLIPKSGAMTAAIQSIQVTEAAPGHPQLLVITENAGGSITIHFGTKPSAVSGSM